MARLRRPAKKKRITINGIDVLLKYNPKLPHFGEFSQENGQPLIEHNVSPQALPPLRASTLFHEALHALDVAHVDLNERQVRLLEQLLPRMIVENWPHFRAIFLAHSKGKPLS